MKKLLIALTIGLVSCGKPYQKQGTYQVCYETRQGTMCDTTHYIEDYSSTTTTVIIYYTKYNEERCIHKDIVKIKEIK